MRNKICRLLADLASTAMQHRFIRDATTESYLLPEDILEVAFEAVQTASWSSTLKDAEREAIRNFERVLRSSEPDLSRPDFFDTDRNWLSVRESAAKCLNELWFDLAEYERVQMEDPTN